MTARQRKAVREQWQRTARGLERVMRDGGMVGRFRIRPEAVAAFYHRAWARGIDVEERA